MEFDFLNANEIKIDGDEVLDLLDHAADGGRIPQFDGVANAAQAKALDDEALSLALVGHAAQLGDADLRGLRHGSLRESDPPTVTPVGCCR